MVLVATFTPFGKSRVGCLHLFQVFMLSQVCSLAVQCSFIQPTQEQTGIIFCKKSKCQTFAFKGATSEMGFDCFPTCGSLLTVRANSTCSVAIPFSAQVDLF